MSDNKVVKAGIGYLIANYLIKGITFLTLPIFARLLSTSDFGTYNIFVTYEGILTLLIGLGSYTSFKSARFKYGFKEEKKSNNYCYEEYVSSFLVLIISVTLILYALVVLFNKQATRLLDLDFFSVSMLVFAALGYVILQYYNYDKSLHYDYKGFVKVGAVNGVLSVVLSIIFILYLFDNHKYHGRMLGTTVTLVGISIVLTMIFIRRHRPGNYKEYYKWGLKYSLPIVPHGLSQLILSQFDRIMIKHMVGIAETGLYSFAFNIFSIIEVTHRALDTVWSQWFFERMEKEDYPAIKKYSSMYMLLILCFSVLIMLASPEMVIILGSSKYLESVQCVIPIVAGGFFAFLYSVPCQVEYYREKTQYVAFGTMGAAFINIVLNYIFIKRYGYVAAAYTTLFTYGLYFLFHLLISIKIEGRNLFSTKIILICVVSLLTSTAISIILMKQVIIRWIMIVAILTVTVLAEEKTVGFLKNKLKKREKDV